MLLRSSSAGARAWPAANPRRSSSPRARGAHHRWTRDARRPGARTAALDHPNWVRDTLTSYAVGAEEGLCTRSTETFSSCWFARANAPPLHLLYAGCQCGQAVQAVTDTR